MSGEKVKNILSEISVSLWKVMWENEDAGGNVGLLVWGKREGLAHEKIQTQSGGPSSDIILSSDVTSCSSA